MVKEDKGQLLCISNACKMIDALTLELWHVCMTVHLLHPVFRPRNLLACLPSPGIVSSIIT